MSRRSKDRVPDLGGFEDLLSEDACLDDDRMLDGLTTKQLGNVGEAIAALYLKERGYDILERNYRCHEGEADLIALDTVEGVIVLVEVKTHGSVISMTMSIPKRPLTIRSAVGIAVSPQTILWIAFPYPRFVSMWSLFRLRPVTLRASGIW